MQIAIVSPSGVIDEMYIDGAVARLSAWGFEVVVTPHARGKYGRFAGTPEERLEDLQWAVNQADISAILCSRGGYGAVQIVDKIDFSPLKKHPKLLIGFSDICAFHSVLTNMKIPSIHGIMAKHLTELNENDLPMVMLRQMLLGKTPQYKIPPHQLNRNGIAEGILTGGNFSVLYGLRGSKFDIKPQGKILFIEDLSEKPYHIDRMMHNLKIGGILEKLSGLIVGQFTEFEEDELMHKTVYEIIAGCVANYNYPVCFNFPAGHVKNNLPLIFGKKHELNVHDNVKLRIKN